MTGQLISGRTCFLAFTTGALIVGALTVLFLSSDSFQWAGRLLAPGLLLAGALGAGVHDAGIIVWTAIGDVLLYGVLTFAAILLVRRCKLSR
jgi:hypothetical protein